MVRLVLFIALAAVAAVALWKLYGMILDRRVDWTGVAFIAGFVVLAIWLRHETGIGGVGG